jgi:hypothetical protein
MGGVLCLGTRALGFVGVVHPAKTGLFGLPTPWANFPSFSWVAALLQFEARHQGKRKLQAP